MMISLPMRRRLLAAIRRRLQASELWLIALSIGVGAAAGLLAVFQGRLAHGLQSLLFGIDGVQRLSAVDPVPAVQLLWLPIGGLVVGGLNFLVGRRRSRPPVDVVEANALHGGRLSLIDSTSVCAQTLLSNGFGASVGLEAAYAQAGGAIGSAAGARLGLRRGDLRTLVGAGAGAAIGAAFGAPLTGAFYAFEVVIGSYAPSALAPVAAASLTSVLVAHLAGGIPYSIHVAAAPSPDATAYLLYSILGSVCALAGIAVMRLVGRVDQYVRASPVPPILRPALGGCLLAILALASPQVLSAGHGALHLDLAITLPLTFLATVLVLKATASVVSLGFGFRGGLFFASLFLGSLIGQIYARGLALTPFDLALSAPGAALVGMGALTVAIVGGPLTLSFLVLETTRDFGIAAATLTASLVATAIVRERFGYSFSTWRLHLRGETIRSARDVGWVRTLTAGRMMRRDTPTVPAATTIGEFRRRHPLGSTSLVILLDDTEHYAGLVTTAAAYAEGVAADDRLTKLAANIDNTLTPEMNIQEVMQVFDKTETEELAVLGPAGEVLGLLAQRFVARRYARELEKVQMDLFGEG